MRTRMAVAVGAITVGLLVTGIAWAAQDPESTVDVGLAESQSTTLPVDDAGVIVLSRADGQLRIVAATPNTGFTAEVEVAAGREVEAEFSGNGRRVQFNAELEDGEVRVRIRSGASDEPGPTSSTGGPTTSNTSPTSTTGSTPTTPATPTAAVTGAGTLVLAEGQVGNIPVEDAGSVLLRRSGGSLTILSAQANAGWAVEVQVSTGREVEGDFRSGGRRVQFNFELEDGVIRIRIESEGSVSSGSVTSTTVSSGSTGTTNTTGTTSGSASISTGSATYNLNGAGTVTVFFANGRVSIGSIDPASGWVVERSEQESDEIRVELTNGASNAELRVRLNDGQLEVEIDG